MLFATMDSDGTLRIRAMNPIEEYALGQWEKQHMAGKAKLLIEKGEALSIAEITAKLGKTVVEFQQWYKNQSVAAIIPGIEDMTAKSDV